VARLQGRIALVERYFVPALLLDDGS